MKKYVYFSALTLGLVLSGCIMDPEIEKTSPEDAQNLVNSFIYKKAPNGLCFGVTTTSRISSNGAGAYNNHVVNVDCSKVGL